MAKNATEFAQELMDAAGVSDAEQKKQLETFLGNDKVKGKLQNVFSDIESANGRAVKADAEARRVYEVNLKIAADNQSVVEAAQKKVQSYVEKFGELPGGGDPNDPNAARRAVSDAIDKKTFDERISVVEGNTIGLVKSVAKITAKHLKDFNEEPDLDAIQKIAVEQGLTADKAYVEWRRPKDEAKKTADHEAAVKKAREEGEVEGRSKVAAGAVTDPDRQSGFLANMRKQDATTDSAKEAFTSGWRESAQKGAGT